MMPWAKDEGEQRQRETEREGIHLMVRYYSDSDSDSEATLNCEEDWMVWSRMGWAELTGAGQGGGVRRPENQ